MTSQLAHKQCVPCRGDVPPLSPEQTQELLSQLEGGWTVERQHHLHKRYAFDNFVQALEFTNKVGAVAEEQGHHPNICLTWGQVELEIWTHAIDGLTESDFILAAKCDEALG